MNPWLNESQEVAQCYTKVKSSFGNGREKSTLLEIPRARKFELQRESQAVGVDRKTVSRWVSKYSDCGIAALQRKVGSGWPRKLEELTEEELKKVVLQQSLNPTAIQCWT